MDISKAKNLKVGNTVHCPSDRGEAAYSGTVTHVSTETNKNIHNTEYLWVTVKKNSHTSHVWPSNRLS